MKLIFSLIYPFPRDKEIIKVLIKMCEFANADFNTVNFKTESWYASHSWTHEQETEFKQWFIEEMKKDNNLFSYFSHGRQKYTKNIQEIADGFCWNYGWKYAD